MQVHYQESLVEDTAAAIIERLVETFEQIQYLIEDLDHANGKRHSTASSLKSALCVMFSQHRLNPTTSSEYNT